MKKELVILFLLIGSVSLLTAGGQKDGDEQFRGRGNRGGIMQDLIENEDPVTVSGTLTLINGEMPSIESNGVKYYVMAPIQYVEDLNLENGMEITVEGFEMPYPRMQWDGSEKSIMVIKAVIDGKEIEIEHPADGSGCMRGPAGGRRNGRGNSRGNGPQQGRRTN